MYKILTYNNIAAAGLDRFAREKYEIASEIQHPDAILLRSHKLHGVPVPETLKAVGRAGAGVNNVPVDEYSQKGIPVFNAPGANANAVKELVLAGMLIAARNICQGWAYTRGLTGDDQALNTLVEKGKKDYVGFELPGRTLGIVGLGAIGVGVANSAHGLGMSVVGYDPLITVKRAWQLSSAISQASVLDELFSKSDFVSLHVPLNKETKHLVNRDRIQLMKEGSILLNFSRGEIVDDEAVCEALDSGKLYAYVTDFPNNHLKDHDRVIALPHLGASTGEAEENSAVMVADELIDYLENGNITNSVNFPEVVMPRCGQGRIAIANENVPHMVSQISTCLADAELNILDLLNKSRGDVAYTLIDIENPVSPEIINQIEEIDGVQSVRLL
ncbi:MAG: phosphoglycerate dehydrogenase [Methylococcales bacterium]